MREAIFPVSGILSPLSAQGVEKQLRHLPGMMNVEVNSAAGTAAAHFDEAVTAPADIQRAIEECGFHCAGELLPKHLCEVPSRGKATHREEHAPPAQKEQIAHEMGHDPGMDMADTAPDMRRRFWISLLFTIPIFAYRPRGSGDDGHR
jgi:Cu2+-exporting ATPase